MKKVNSLKSMSKLGGRAWSPVRSPSSDSFVRQKSTSSMPALSEVAKVEGTKIQATQWPSSAKVNNIDPVPEHHDSHAGPYGVEMPLEWSFHVTVTDVVVEVKGVLEAQKESLGGEKEYRS
ncbi:hypothetical protein EK21DRAFT_115175 [Setomelanomma holmii]|uniref:Uncharacterized protein n=1 Tax=Setomelanomma holmii TaxID=210430 RepID=A0A9P4H3M4_9PLEO|nr:hypothetical protein EK21DRAFT_115175 [Setomelanomma holmii]